jgi:hypothetical protein
MRYCAFAVALLLFAGFVFSADVDGKWTGEIEGMDGNKISINYTFKADGATLTGSTSGPDGSQIAIKDGKIDGSNISFSVTFDFGGQEMKMEYKGVVSGNQIKLTFDMMGQQSEILLKKAS